MAWLTKSRFLAGLQCARRLWFEVHAPPEQVLAESLPLLNGRAVDALVQRLAPGPVISRAQGMPAAIAATARLLQGGAPPVVYQPAFRRGDLAVIADVLRHDRGSSTLVEVKSGTAVKPEYLPDIAFQALVLRQARQPVDRMLIAHVDREFELRSAGDYRGLMREVDVTAAVEESLPAVAEQAAGCLSVLQQGAAPAVAMGPHCTVPYECPFIARCRGGGPEPEFPLELLPRGGRAAERLRARGYTELTEVPEGELESALHQRVHQATVTGAPYYDACPTAPLRSLAFPIAYLDFETIGLAVPAVLGMHPYESAPFQWSVHVENADGTTAHAEYLAGGELGDFEALASGLLAVIPAGVPVLAYNAGFERGVLLQLAQWLPRQANALRDIAARLIDLLPVTRAAWYHRDMKGSWSLKAVLRTIAPELDYATLETVREGEGAQLAFLRLMDADPASAEARQLRAALLRYCERDTWAMVVLRRFLCAGPG